MKSLQTGLDNNYDKFYLPQCHSVSKSQTTDNILR